jgi:signal transduction histidine kinase
VEWIDDRFKTVTYNLGAHVPVLDWVVVLSQPRSEIFSYIYKNIFWAATVTLMICVVAIVLGWRWTRRILVPIQELHMQVKKIGAGDLEHKVVVDTEDEIGELGRAFNDMTDSLKAHILREIETAKSLAHARNLAVLGTASSKVTHEVGNFLNNADMALSALKREPVSDRGKRILAVLENDSVRVKAFIQNFLGFAKKPELILKKRPLDLILKEVIGVFQVESEQRNIPIRFQWPNDIPMASVDAGMIHQAFANLFKNAMEAVDHDGEIVVEGKSEAGRVVLTVADSGPGMPPEIRDQIFEPFFTTKGKTGTGLGMAIVKTIVEAHRGVIECQSRPGGGTVFTILLPLR